MEKVLFGGREPIILFSKKDFPVPEQMFAILIQVEQVGLSVNMIKMLKHFSKRPNQDATFRKACISIVNLFYDKHMQVHFLSHTDLHFQ